MRAVAVILVLALPSTAASDPFDSIRGSASLEYAASYVHATDRDLAATDGLALAGVHLRGAVSPSKTVQYRVGIDLRAGSTVLPAGFAYDVDLLPIGVGVRLGRWSRFGVSTGGGVRGAIGSMDDGPSLVVDTGLELGLGNHVRVIARGRAAWLAGRSGAPSADFVDELDATFAIRIGRRKVQYDFPAGNGYFFGVAYREADGARFVGGVIGHSIDVGSR
jgi:hypothetical protein